MGHCVIYYFAARGKSWGVSIDDKSSQGLACRCLWVRIGTCQNKVPIGMSAVCDPHFLSVDDVMVAFLLGLCLDIGNVRASARLSDTVSLKYGKQTIKCQ